MQSWHVCKHVCKHMRVHSYEGSLHLAVNRPSLPPSPPLLHGPILDCISGLSPPVLLFHTFPPSCRLGQFMISTLPLPREYSEVNIDLYAEIPPTLPGVAADVPGKGSKVASGKDEADGNVGGEEGEKEEGGSTKEDASSTKGDAASVKGDAASIKGDAASIKGDAASIKGDSASIKGDTASIKGDTASIKGGITHSSSTASFSPTPSAPPNLAKAIRHIVVRNFLLDMLVSLSQTEHLEVDSK